MDINAIDKHLKKIKLRQSILMILSILFTIAIIMLFFRMCKKDSGRNVLTTPVSSVNGKTGVVNVDKYLINLDNVDNTSDLDKPVSKATQKNIDELRHQISNLNTLNSNVANTTNIFNTVYTKQEVNNLITNVKPISIIPGKNISVTKFGDSYQISSSIDLSLFYSKSEINNLLDKKVNKSNLHKVATTGDYNDLDNKPDLRHDSVSVKDFGAKCDGSTDDTAAIQAAIDKASSDGGNDVRIPIGTCIVSANPGISVKDNVKLAGSGLGSVIKLKDNAGVNDNIIKVENAKDVSISELRIDGNRVNQTTSNTQYGLYIGKSERVIVSGIIAENINGVGLQSYSSNDLQISNVQSFSNRYHGFEVEQTVNSTFTNIVGSKNDRHGILISPGEISGKGSKGNHISNFIFSNNGEYGIASNAANGDVSAHLNDGNSFSNGSVFQNAHYGISLYKQSYTNISNIYVFENGMIGLYLFQSSYNNISNMQFHNNSKSSNASYDDILNEGATSGYASQDNNYTNIQITADGSSRSRFGIRDADINDKNKYINISFGGVFTSSNYQVSRLSSFEGKVGTPASPGESCVKGQTSYDNDYIYICINDNSWKRSPMNSW